MNKYKVTRARLSLNTGDTMNLKMDIETESLPDLKDELKKKYDAKRVDLTFTEKDEEYIENQAGQDIL